MYSIADLIHHSFPLGQMTHSNDTCRFSENWGMHDFVYTVLHKKRKNSVKRASGDQKSKIGAKYHLYMTPNLVKSANI